MMIHSHADQREASHGVALAHLKWFAEVLFEAVRNTTTSIDISHASQRRSECRAVHLLLVISALSASAVKRNLVVV
jgi:hypothetical protein